jgi:hypothetical protein
VTIPVELPDRENPWQSYILTITLEISRDALALRLRE